LEILLIVPISHTHYVIPPIGLGYLATAARINGFIDIAIYDCLKEKHGWESFIKVIKEAQPKLVGIQVFSYDVASVNKSLSLIKQIDHNIITVVGGVHLSATDTVGFKKMPDADYGFAGEAEIGFPLLLKKILRGKDISFMEIPGLIYRINSDIKANMRIINENLDALAFPAWDLMPPATYPDNPQGAFYQNFPIAPISTTRGCPFQCTFCASSVNMGRKLRERSIPHVLSEMELLYDKFGVREFHIIDDAFNFHKDRVLEFCAGIEKSGRKISYTFPNGLRLNMLDAKVLKRMKDTGAYAFTVGVESGSQRILDAMKKQLTLELIKEKIELICKAGLEPSGFFIIGYPSETKEDIKKTIAFAKKLPLKRAHFSNFLPLPGTEATAQLIARGEIGQFNYQDLFYSKVPYSPRFISKKELKALQRKAFLSFYLRPKILIKMLSEIRSWRHFISIYSRVYDYLFVK
jgi:anaerobic magnesium-protoporphyrin IX monomethyl ester cyclase